MNLNNMQQYGSFLQEALIYCISVCNFLTAYVYYSVRSLKKAVYLNILANLTISFLIALIHILIFADPHPFYESMRMLQFAWALLYVLPTLCALVVIRIFFAVSLAFGRMSADKDKIFFVSIMGALVFGALVQSLITLAVISD